MTARKVGRGAKNQGPPPRSPSPTPPPPPAVGGGPGVHVEGEAGASLPDRAAGVRRAAGAAVAGDLPPLQGGGRREDLVRRRAEVPGASAEVAVEAVVVGEGEEAATVDAAAAGVVGEVAAVGGEGAAGVRGEGEDRAVFDEGAFVPRRFCLLEGVTCVPLYSRSVASIWCGCPAWCRARCG